MDATPIWAPGADAPVTPDDPRRTELLLDALKAAIGTPGEHRLFRSGKLAGLFPSRAGLSAGAAVFAVRTGLLETVRSETRGKVVTEWVRADRVFAVVPLEGAERGDRRRTYVHVEGLSEPLVASRSERAILADVDAALAEAAGVPGRRRRRGGQDEHLF